MTNRKLRMGMIGGGINSFIGAVHRRAAIMDGEIELVCGVFDADAEISIKSGLQYYLDQERIYRSYDEMIEKESKLPENLKMDFVVIVTPNHLHFEPAKLALENGFHVICEKPVTLEVAEAEKLKTIANKNNLQFAVTHPYRAYPLVTQAKQIVEDGTIGKIRKVIVEYSQGWLSTYLESEGHQQATWRTNPKKAGKAGSIGDIGTHAFNLCEHVTGLKISSLCADLTTFVKGRQLEDDANVLLRFDNGAKGLLIASQISAGEENNLKLRVYGEKGSIEWSQMEPNTLLLRWLDKPMQFIRAGADSLCKNSLNDTRLPMGHPEGLIEAFANIYKNFAYKLRNPQVEDANFPTIEEGIRTMKFIDTVVKSAEKGNSWVEFGS